MSTFDAIGTVPPFDGEQFLLPIDNAEDFRQWLRDNKVTTLVNDRDGKPAVKMRGSFAAKCHPGEKICHTIECTDKGGKRGFRGLSVRRIS